MLTFCLFFQPGSLISTGGQLPLERCDPGVGGLHLLVPVQRGRHVPLPPLLQVVPEWRRVDSQMKQFVQIYTISGERPSVIPLRLISHL